MEISRTLLQGVVTATCIASCKHDPVIVEEAPRAVAVAETTSVDAAATSDAPTDAGDAGDAEEDACVPGDTWEARVVVRKTWHESAKMMLQGPIELEVARLGIRRTVYPDCGMTGGGCRPTEVSEAHTRFFVGIDDVGPTDVNVIQRNDSIVAVWTTGADFDAPLGAKPTHRTELLVKLPCSVKIRFVK